MEEQKNRIKGIVGTLIFHLAIIFILFLLALRTPLPLPCLLYTSDAADDLLCVDLGGRRIIKNKTLHKNTTH